ncbi:hypothetical protein VTK73DRAFT_1037 [Phialemonium thermophilum]|uniref:CHCH domain-containing protein n=1 Tax=Phialemonium thermophilum TaxID=223376 RepID=A0ABR3VU18_9PEZI
MLISTVLVCYDGAKNERTHGDALDEHLLTAGTPGYRIDDINKSCLDEFRTHWQCLDNNNHQLWQCRPAEWKLNKCVYENLKLEKVVPDQPKNSTPVHLRRKQIYAHNPILRKDEPFVPQKAEAAPSS